MKVIIFKLDIPGWKDSWLVKDFTVKALDDIEQIVGFCANHIYAELYYIDENDDPLLVKKVSSCLAEWYPSTAKDTIIRLFKMLEKVAEIWGNKSESSKIDVSEEVP